MDLVSEGSSMITDEDRALLLKASVLLEELIETFDILKDEETMRAIRESKKT